jgi:UDPglucose--hexose-1-phosphate uridylyltransferase
MAGSGTHEVIIETPAHNASPAFLPYDQVEKVLTAYHQRYNALRKNAALRSIVIFKNHGWASGTSLPHPHSQLVATPIVAPFHHQGFAVAGEYYRERGRCLYCDLLEEERNNGERIIFQNGHFTVFHPYACHAPYETWIVPGQHCASFGLFPGAHLAALARALKDTLLCLHRALGDPAFNMMVLSIIAEEEADPSYHWHIRIIPRLTTIAGFEMGSGIYINIALPEETAGKMRACYEKLSEEGKISEPKSGSSL